MRLGLLVLRVRVTLPRLVLNSGHNVALNHHAAGSFICFSGISLNVPVDLSIRRLRRTGRFEAITACLILLSVGILIAQAWDAFRPWT
jgi:hypothetical protein